MSLYFRISNPLDVRELSDQMAAWTAASNPKSNDWTEQPAAPSADSTWTADATWVEPDAPTYTAEAWLEAQGYGGSRPTTLLYFRLQLQASAKSCPTLDAVQGWLDGIIAVGAQDPDALHANLSAAPYDFATTCQAALAALQAQ